MVKQNKVMDLRTLFFQVGRVFSFPLFPGVSRSLAREPLLFRDLPSHTELFLTFLFFHHMTVQQGSYRWFPPDHR